MAFFCPMRIPRRRRKRYREDQHKDSYRGNGNPRGRITGSNSLDSLTDLGREEEDSEIEFEPRKMIVMHDFIPCVEDEVAVKRGQHVKALYQETDWIYVVPNDRKEGFVPFTYCVSEEEYEKRKEKQNGLQRSNFRNASFLDSLQIQTDVLTTPAFSFKKNDYGNYIVKFDFVACDENDINVQKGEIVRVLNKEDDDWYWVANVSGIEGFIPKDFLAPREKLQNGDARLSSSQMLMNRCSSELQVSPTSMQVRSPVKDTSPDSSETVSSGASSSEPFVFISQSVGRNGSRPLTPTNPVNGFRPRRNSNELLLYGQELVCTDTHVSNRMDELSIYKGDWIYADMKHKDSRGWVWAYSPSNKMQGYVPKSCLRPPATTPL